VTASQPSTPPPRIYGPKEHRITRADIDPDALKVVLRLVRSGYKAYIVGGGVRDILIGKIPKDFDISTDASPRDVKALFRNSRIIGRRFQLVHVFFAGGKNLEVSTFRDTADVFGEAGAADTTQEGETPSQPAGDNVFGTEQTDALRRDLTINGLFLDLTSMSIIDYVGGMEDLNAGLVRVIGDPATRFKEDPVRMIRVIRHSARNGFSIERGCWSAVIDNSHLLSKSAAVRIFDEVKKDLTSGHLLTILSLLQETGLLEQIIPELLENQAVHLTDRSDFSRSIELIDEWVSSGEEVSPTVPLTIMAIFTAGSSLRAEDIADEFESLGDFNEALSSTFTSLAVPRKERERISLLASAWWRVQRSKPEALSPGANRRLQLLPELVIMCRALAAGPADAARVRHLERILASRRETPERLPHRAHRRHDHR
jgi:poly(A) polymerase